MAKAKFLLENDFDCVIARQWIAKKLEGFYFPHAEDIEDYDSKNQLAKDQFSDLNDNDINKWCELHLNKSQWKTMKGTIRAARLRKSRKFGKSNQIKRIDISENARYILKTISEKEQLTYSEVIEKYLSDTKSCNALRGNTT